MLLFLALLLVPLIEIGLFIEVGGFIGLWPTIGIVILTAVIGTALLRAQGVATLRELQARLARGDDPGRTLAHGALILVAGAVLLTPGFFTDAVGFLLLIPPVREVAISWLAKRMLVAGSVHMASGAHWQGRAGPGMDPRTAPRPGSPKGATIDGDFEPVGDADDTPNAPPNAPLDPPKAP
ncbi:MAG: FxsA family protein [Pseudomonadota bacterium]